LLEAAIIFYEPILEIGKLADVQGLPGGRKGVQGITQGLRGVIKRLVGLGVGVLMLGTVILLIGFFRVTVRILLFFGRFRSELCNLSIAQYLSA
jgi:hypothetical protein